MDTTLDDKHKPKASKGWLTKTALVLFAALALTDLTGCAALKNSADTLGNAAGTQVTKAGLWAMGKDADCHFDATNHSSYSPGGPSNSGTVTANGCRELPSTATQIKLAEQQEAVYNTHFREQQKRAEEAMIAQAKLQQLRNEEFKKQQALQRAEMMAQQAADTCHRRELDLLRDGKKMDPSEGCVTILQQDKLRTEELLAQAKKPAPMKQSTGFFSGWTLKD